MNAANAKAQEPSMEEILASIRRIIADDQEVANAPEPAARAVPDPQPEPALEHEADEDVLDLAEVSSPLNASRPPMLEHETPDISFKDEDTSSVDFDAIPVEEPPEAPQPPQPVPAPNPMPAFAPEPPRAHSEPDRLLSQSADASVGHAFNLLAHTVLTNNARTLEDLVREMLRPMLKNWLDDNLPTLVERLVRAEIERVARSGR
jgi:uncharacterized protein